MSGTRTKKCQYQRRAVPRPCPMDAKYMRLTSEGRLVALCAKCDESFGETVGLPAGVCVCGKTATVRNLVNGKWECDECFRVRCGRCK